MKKFKLSVAGIGNVGTHVIKNLFQKDEFVFEKTSF